MGSFKVLSYSRCSTVEMATEGMSLDAQRSKIAAWAELHDAEISCEIRDAGVSGTRPMRDRPGGSEVASLLDARAPVIEAVVVVRLDRLGRDAAETLDLLKRFARSKVGLVSISDRIDLASPAGRAMAQMSAVFAELERSLIAQRTSEALCELRAQGRVYGPVPFGFDRSDGLLVPNEQEQRVLRSIMRGRSSGLSYAKVASSLNGRKIPSKRGLQWSGPSVRSVVKTAELMASG